METVTTPAVLPTAPQKHGQGVRALVEARQRELELELSEMRKSNSENGVDIEAAIGALKALMTGNLDQIPPVLAQELSQWIETSKYLGAQMAAPDPAVRSSATVVKEGRELRALIEARRQQRELDLSEAKKAAAANDKRGEIEAALTALQALLVGDLDQIPPAVAAELSQFIETNKYLGTKEHRAAPQ